MSRSKSYFLKSYSNTWPKCYKYSVPITHKDLMKEGIAGMTHDQLHKQYGAILRIKQTAKPLPPEKQKMQVRFKRKRDAVMFAMVLL